MDEDGPLSIRQTFGLRLGQAARQWRLVMNERLLPFGLTEATWLPLVHIAHGGKPMRQKDLADALGIESSSLVRLIDALVDGGLVERKIEDDRRARTLFLTPRGRQTAARVKAVGAEVRERVLAGISDAELQISLHAIERICAALMRERA
jgi:MarR family transcriptional regulator for hemolysin